MNKKKLPSLIPILILTLVTVIMWVVLDVYQALKKPVELTVPANVSQPLTPSLDQNTINQLESKTFLNDSQIPDEIVSSTPAPPVSTPVPTPSLPIEQTTQPTESTESGTIP